MTADSVAASDDEVQAVRRSVHESRTQRRTACPP
ncbi:hypothetical protein OK006_9098 [Actinobacteria bacterium OK006]|jgi:hypothetical protein|nr:hypothetical protein OK006_9098 [Actinobacteria bacterium OK006]